MPAFSTTTAVPVALLLLASSSTAAAHNCSVTPCASDAEFCGTDDACHLRTCDTWYEFGLPEYTGYNPDFPAPLTCRAASFAPGDELYALVYGCKGYGPGSAPEPWTEAVTAKFTRECSAGVNATATFTCHDLGAFAKPTIDQFVAKVERNTTQCTDSDGNGPLYINQVHYAWEEIYRASYVYSGSSGTTLNHKAARHTLSSMLSSKPKTPAPTPAPIYVPTPAPSTPAPNAANQRGVTGGVLAVLGCVVLAMVL